MGRHVSQSVLFHHVHRFQSYRLANRLLQSRPNGSENLQWSDSRRGKSEPLMEWTGVWHLPRHHCSQWPWMGQGSLQSTLQEAPIGKGQSLGHRNRYSHILACPFFFWTCLLHHWKRRNSLVDSDTIQTPPFFILTRNVSAVPVNPNQKRRLSMLKGAQVKAYHISRLCFFFLSSQKRDQCVVGCTKPPLSLSYLFLSGDDSEGDFGR